MLDIEKRWATERALEGKNSDWLNVLPIPQYHFILFLIQFRDTLVLRYKSLLLRMSAHCDGCGGVTMLNMPWTAKWGLIIERHNEVRDSLGGIFVLAYHEVLKEPIVRGSDPATCPSGLIAGQSWGIIVGCMCHKHWSHISHSWKREKLWGSIKARWTSFSPFIVMVDGLLGWEANTALQRIAEVLPVKWNWRYNQAMGGYRHHCHF